MTLDAPRRPAVRPAMAALVLAALLALVGDVATPADRGRHQGRFGSVYGVAGIAGPLLGGLFTDHLSWQWAFLVNVPVGLVPWCWRRGPCPPRPGRGTAPGSTTPVRCCWPARPPRWS
ncbi:MFS transporter [Amycolatopsis rifamycinica]|uniref:Major facilitator superfamily (MFS) profile domain-containing protein n=1 Tax=Amycolatopsis rifamycinica TaxID=287986 RepID=A0A066UA67_9PSEU|nr:MFS transporter [Amycolatopsis rifamycinica]KDN24010.1 hypothetical protein DV20_01075 [Amycolatopsis rifamycinica]